METETDSAIVTIRDSHTNITKITVNGKVEFRGVCKLSAVNRA